MSSVSSANQYTSDPREQVMWDIYITKLTTGIDNAYQSALEAGYAEDTAKNVTLTGWYKDRKERLKRHDMLSKAEKKLEKILDYEPVDEAGKLDVPLLRVQADVSKHVTSTLGKDEGYSTRTEQTGKGGGAIQIEGIEISVRK
jgi:hypothetical protein